MSDEHDPLVRAVSSILSRGAYGIEEVETLRAAAADKIDVVNCRLADHTLAWLMQRSERGIRRGPDSLQVR